MSKFVRKEDIGNGCVRRVILCCGHELLCMGFTNTCGSCGADYNMSGQELAPRSQWGEETGESVADILSADFSE